MPVISKTIKYTFNILLFFMICCNILEFGLNGNIKMYIRNLTDTNELDKQEPAIINDLLTSKIHKNESYSNDTQDLTNSNTPTEALVNARSCIWWRYWIVIIEFILAVFTNMVLYLTRDKRLINLGTYRKYIQIFLTSSAFSTSMLFWYIYMIKTNESHLYPVKKSTSDLPFHIDDLYSSVLNVKYSAIVIHYTLMLKMLVEEIEIFFIRFLEPNQSSIDTSTKTEYKLVIDMNPFNPAEISYAVEGQFAILRGKRTENWPNKKIIRETEQKYLLPNTCIYDEIKFSYDQNNIFTITASCLEHPVPVASVKSSKSSRKKTV